MSEHRALWTTFGAALVAIGLGGLVSLAVGEALLLHPDVGRAIWPGIGCAVVFVLGAGILSQLLVIYRKLRRRRQDLGIRIGEGVILLREARNFSPEPDDDGERLAVLGRGVSEWRMDTFKFLKEQDVADAMHFENQAGGMTTEALLGNLDAMRYALELDVRLQRLAEIVNRW